MNQFQITKGQTPLRLPFASFRLIFGLEKTLDFAEAFSLKNTSNLPYPQHVQQELAITDSFAGYGYIAREIG